MSTAYQTFSCPPSIIKSPKERPGKLTKSRLTNFNSNIARQTRGTVSSTGLCIINIVPTPALSNMFRIESCSLCSSDIFREASCISCVLCKELAA